MHGLSIVSFRIINVKVLRGMFRVSYQITTRKIGQSFLEFGP